MKHIRQPDGLLSQSRNALLPDDFDETKVRDFFAHTPRKVADLDVAAALGKRRETRAPRPCKVSPLVLTQPLYHLGFSTRAHFAKTLKLDVQASAPPPNKVETAPPQDAHPDFFEADHFILNTPPRAH